ncbi:hypothetical protein [Pseudomonas aeruginosa]
MVRNGHENAQGSQYAVWATSDITAVFKRFVSECERVTETQARLSCLARARQGRAGSIGSCLQQSGIDPARAFLATALWVIEGTTASEAACRYAPSRWRR